MFSLLEESLPASIALFAACALVIGFFGVKLTAIADQLADRAGFGEALVGGILLGAVTSLSGSVLSVSAALNGMPELALGNAIGGLAAQTAFLAVADIFYRRANLEHAAASSENIMQGALLVCTLSVLLLGKYSPQWTIWSVHPATPLLIGSYIYGMGLVKRSKMMPMWIPRTTAETRTDEPELANEELGLSGLWVHFVAYAAILGVSGWVLQKGASSIVGMTGLNEVVMGVLFTSVTTSLPELVTSIAAVRRGALTMAVSGIIGGNAYDTLFVAFSDIAYREGSIYAEITPAISLWIAISLMMGGILIMGLLLREKRGIGNIGFESFFVCVLYLVGAAVLIADTLS